MRHLATQGWGALAHNTWKAISFFDHDHGEGSDNALAWVDGLLQQHGIKDAVGEIWLHCYPRVWGHAFKPVSFWYCHGKEGDLRAIVVEVNNTFGERHVYLLSPAHLDADLQARKVFHVSPFCQIRGRYTFRFHISDDLAHTVARVDYHDGETLVLRTSIQGHLVPLSPASLRKAAWAYGPLTLLIVARIHWQAFRLWLKRIPYSRKPPPSTPWVTR
jgi:DUF1365 family protein